MIVLDNDTWRNSKGCKISTDFSREIVRKCLQDLIRVKIPRISEQATARLSFGVLCEQHAAIAEEGNRVTTQLAPSARAPAGLP